MKRTILFSICCFFFLSSKSQDTESIQQSIEGFFRTIQTIDTTHLRNLCTEEVSLTSSFIKNGVPQYKKSSMDAIIQQVGKMKPNALDERISHLHIEQYGHLATATMNYKFYVNDVFSHCGINLFTLIKSDQRWLISSISDTRSQNCEADHSSEQIDSVITQWHMAATEADSTQYFDLIANNGVFVGTDSSEVWTKDEFLTFAAPYFAKGKAWDFKTIERNIYIHQPNIAWFDELLDTWMGTCRGSGVVKYTNGQWKISHYVLSVTVPNDKIKKYIRIMTE